MTIQADIISALTAANVAGNRVYPQYAPEDKDPPLVVVSRTVYEPVNLLTGPEGTAKSTFLFACWGDTQPGIGAKGRALALASEVKAAIAAAPLLNSGTVCQFQEPVNGEDFEPETLEIMEPLLYSFWHQDA